MAGASKRKSTQSQVPPQERRLQTSGIAASIALFIAGAIVATAVQGLLAPAIANLNSQPLVAAFGFLLALLAICLFAITVQIAQVNRHNDKTQADVHDLLSRSIGVEYFEAGEHGQYEELVFGKFTEVVRKAESYIYVVNSVITEHGTETDESSVKARDQYYDTLLRLATDEHEHRVKYRRILQLRKGQTLQDLHLGNEYIRHFDMILKEIDKAPDVPIRLQTAAARRFVSFVLVDDYHLIWQIDDLRETPDLELRIHGVFIIDDPTMKITAHFKDFFEALESSYTCEITKADLNLIRNPRA